MRSLTLLGLVLLFVAVGGDAFAQVLYSRAGEESIANLGFPYLSPDVDQRSVLMNAFRFQMALFGAISGAGAASVPAMKLLGMTGILVGALMIIFNPKHRKVPVLFTWLLLVVITIFAPFGSMYLFHPQIAQRGGNGEASTTSGDCMSTPLSCGFTPQLAGIHIASVLQLTLSDMFNSIQWKGLIEQANALRNLSSSPKLDAGADWLDQISRLQRPEVCGDNFSWADRTAYRRDNTQTDGDRIVPYTMAGEWAKLKDRFLDSSYMDSPTRFPPPAIVLYDESSFPGGSSGSNSSGADSSTDSIWSSAGVRSDYANGIGSIYRSVTGSTKAVVFDENGLVNEATKVNVKQALTEMESLGFFKAVQDTGCGIFSNVFSDGTCGVMPGLFFIWKKDTDVSTAGSAAAANSAQIYRRCYTQNVRALGGRPRQGLVCPSYYAPSAQASSFTGMVGRIGGSSASAESSRPAVRRARGATTNVTTRTDDVGAAGSGSAMWRTLLRPIDGYSDLLSSLTSMPVGLATYELGATSAEAPAQNVHSGLSCLAENDRLIDEGITRTLGANGRALELVPMKTALLGEGKTLTVDSNGSLALTQLRDASLSLCNDSSSTSSSTSSSRQSQCMYVTDKGLASDFILAFDRVRRDLIVLNSGDTAYTPTPADNYDVLLRVAIDAIHDSTVARLTTAVEQRATDDTTRVDIVGIDALTTVGGMGARFFGTVLAQIGAWFTGPLSSAIVYFLSILVNMALLILIVMTPILFVIGLAMPGAAMGLLTIAIMGAFILKLTPVTLLILNNIGGMVYDVIGAAGGANRGVMQDLMILAMAGLYANVVGLTFFMLFKLGDANTVLSKFTAIDGSAKQIAERGLAATVTAAALAASAVGGAVGAVGGRAALGRAAARAAHQLGVPDEVISTAQSLAQRGGTRDDEPGQNGQGTSGTGAGDNKPLTNPDGSPLLDSQGNPITDPAQKQRLLDRAGDVTTVMGQFGNTHGMTPAEAHELVARESVTTANGDVFARNEDGTYSWKGTGMAREDTADQIVGSGPDIPNAGGGAGGGGGNGPLPPGPGTAPRAVGSSGPGGGTPPAGGGQTAQPTAQDQLVQQALAQQQAQVTAQSVTDTMRKLDTIANDTSLAQSTRDAARDAMQQLKSAPSSDTLRSIDSAMDKAFAEDNSGLSMDRYEDRMVRLNSLNDDLADRRRRFNQQYGARMESLTAKSNSGSLSKAESDELQNLSKVYENLNKKYDTGELVIGDMAGKLGQYDRLKAALDTKINADKLPGYGMSALSGVYGAFAGAGGGLAKIPVVGSMISEVLNENHQAPERARAWAAAGGFSKWRELQSSAKRMGFYNKEMAPITAGTQYESMLAVGGFQAQADIARQTVNESVARSRSLHDAMFANKTAGRIDAIASGIDRVSIQAKVKADNKELQVGSVDFNRAVDVEFNKELSRQFTASVDMSKTDFKAFMGPGDLIGIGRIEAADRVHSVRAEAALAQGHSFKAERLAGGGTRLDFVTSDDLLAHGEVKTEKFNAMLTPELLNSIRGMNAVKGAGGKIGDVLTDSYGVLEKLHLRGDAAWTAAIGLENNASAARNYAIKDIDNDYAMFGHIRMVQGKHKNMGDMGVYSAMIDMRNDSNEMIADHLNKNFAAGNTGLQNAVKKAVDDARRDTPNLDMSMIARTAADKWAKEDMRKNNILLPIEGYFAESQSSAAAKFRQGIEVSLDNAAAQAVENKKKWRRSAGAAFEADLPQIAKLDTQLRIDRNGHINDLGTVAERMAEVNRKISEKNYNQLNFAMKKFLKDNPDALDVQISGGGKGKKRIANASIKAEYTDKLLKAYKDELDGQMDGKSESVFKSFIKAGAWLFGSTD